MEDNRSTSAPRAEAEHPHRVEWRVLVELNVLGSAPQDALEVAQIYWELFHADVARLLAELAERSGYFTVATLTGTVAPGKSPEQGAVVLTGSADACAEADYDDYIPPKGGISSFPSTASWRFLHTAPQPTYDASADYNGPQSSVNYCATCDVIGRVEWSSL